MIEICTRTLLRDCTEPRPDRQVIGKRIRRTSLASQGQIKQYVSSMLRVMLFSKAYPKTHSQSRTKALHHDLYDIVMPFVLRLEDTRAAMSPSGRPCIVPGQTTVGDLVVILGGSQMPWVLRPVQRNSGTAYRIIGPAYVHGLMDGEAMSPSTRWSEVALV